MPNPPELNEFDFAALNRFAEAAHANARARGFHDTADRLKRLAVDVRLGIPGYSEPDPELHDLLIASYYGNRLMLIVSEAVEAQEELRHGHAPDEEYEVNGKPEGVISELDDIVVRVGDLIEEIKPSRLGESLAGKMGYNGLREHRHGGKKF